MARDINIIRTINVAVAKGLCRPKTAPATPWCFWHEQGMDRLPPVIRYCWQPQTGHLYAGVTVHHSLLVPPDPQYPLGSYLCGFSLPPSRIVSLKPFFWPTRPDDQWDGSHAALHDAVADVFLSLLKPALPRGARTFRSIDTPWFQRMGFTQVPR